VWLFGSRARQTDGAASKQAASKQAASKQAASKQAASKQAAKSAKPASREIDIKIDRALAQAWKKLSAVLKSANVEGMHAWDRKYEAVGEIMGHEPPLYLAGGVSTAGDFIAQYLPGEQLRSVLRNVRVAQYASPDEEVKYGTSKIDAVVDYLEAKHGKPTKGRIPVDFDKLRIDEKKGWVAFTAATVDQIRAATRRLAAEAGTAKPAKRSPIVLAITKNLPTAARDVTVHYAGGRVSLGRIPVEQFASVLRALASTALPAEK